MNAADVRAFLARLEASGVVLALNASGDGLRVMGKGKPSPEVLEEVRRHKPALLAHMRGEDLPPVEAPDPAQVGPQSGEEVPRRFPLPDWESEAAKPGRCGSCARAIPAPDWGPLMVACGCRPEAWEPVTPPYAVHVGAKCGAYLMPGEEVGRGYRSRTAAKTWGTGQTLPLRPAAKRPA